MRGHILVIDDEKHVYDGLLYGLGQAHEVHYASKLVQVSSRFRYYPIDLAFVDLDFQPEKEDEEKNFSGLEYIQKLRQKYPTLTIATLSGYSDEDKIVQAAKNGADHYLIKGEFDMNSPDFKQEIQKWIKTKKKKDQLREQKRADSWGKTEFPKSVLDKARAFFLDKQSFILIGEPGLGTSQLLQDTFIGSRIFHYEKEPDMIDLNAFQAGQLLDFLSLKRGSTSDNFLKNPTLPIQYLRNLDHQPLSVQESFLELVQRKKFLGKEEPFTTQLVFILEQDPLELMKEHKLLPGFASYLSQLRLQPLRERRKDLKTIIQYWQKHHEASNLSFSEAAMTLLRRYPYPGNISELYQILNQALSAHKKRYPIDWRKKDLQADNIPNKLHQTRSDLFEQMKYEVARVELSYIEHALLMFEGERRQKDLAAIELQVHSADNLKKTFINKYWKKYPDLVKGFPTIVKKYKLK